MSPEGDSFLQRYRLHVVVICVVVAAVVYMQVWAAPPPTEHKQSSGSSFMETLLLLANIFLLGAMLVMASRVMKIVEALNGHSQKMEEVMVTDLQDSDHGEAARWVPVLIALVNGSAPLIISLFIMLPLWMAYIGIPLPVSPLHLAILFALLTVFLLGVFLGKVAGISWLHSGLRTLLLALLTAALIYLFAG